MQGLHSGASKSVSQIGAAAVFFEVEGDRVKHVGLLYRNSDSPEVRKLHLAWNFLLREEDSSEITWWLDPSIDELRLIQVAAIGRKIWRSNGKRIPYGFSHPNDAFDTSTGQLLIGPTRHGLTCASFVLAVFHCAGLPLICYEEWPLDRPEDREWQDSIVGLLQEHHAEESHVAAVRNQVESGVARYRPGEVSGATLEEKLPVRFKVAERNSQRIACCLRGEPLPKSIVDQVFYGLSIFFSFIVNPLRFFRGG